MKRQGFTLLEVIVAVVILSVGLSSLFTSEAAAIKMAQRARTTTISTLLARCKMGEIEERIGKEGWPGTDLRESDDCCEDAERDGFTCNWSVLPIILPEMEQETQLGDAPKDGAGAGGTAGGAATNALNNLGVPLSGNPTDLLSMAGGGGGGGGGDPIATLVLQMAFPVMKPLIESQVRRVTVEVNWKEGGREHSLSVIQYLVNEMPVLAAEEEEDQPSNQPSGGGGGGGGGATAGGATGGTSTGQGTSR